MSKKNQSNLNKWTVIHRDGKVTDPANPPADPKNPPADPPADPKTPKSWQEFFDAQPEPIKKLYGEHHTGLQNSIKATRDERDAFEKQLKELLPKAEKGSELEKSLTEALGKLTVQTKKSDFFEAGTKPEIGCTDLSVAFLLAEAKDLWKKDGSPDWEEIKKAFPKGFTKITDPNQKPIDPISPTDPKLQVALTKESIEKMSPEEINKNWDAVQTFLKNQNK